MSNAQKPGNIVIKVTDDPEVIEKAWQQSEPVVLVGENGAPIDTITAEDRQIFGCCGQSQSAADIGDSRESQGL